VEIIPGFSNDILDNQELNRRFQERLAALRSKRKAPDGDISKRFLLTYLEPENAEHSRKRQKIEKRRSEKKEKKQGKQKSKPKAGPVVPKVNFLEENFLRCNRTASHKQRGEVKITWGHWNLLLSICLLEIQCLFIYSKERSDRPMLFCYKKYSPHFSLAD
jgi:hypothetical protein